MPKPAHPPRRLPFVKLPVFARRLLVAGRPARRPDPHAALRARQVGAAPGTLNAQPGALPPRLFLFSFDLDEIYEKEYDRYDELLQAFRARPDLKHWIDVRGYGDAGVLAHLRDDFQLSALQLEDVLHDYQRPKVEVDDTGRFFIVTRMLELRPNYTIDNDQLSIFTGPNYVITLQSDYDDCLHPLRARLRSERSLVRRRPVLYVAYAALDTVLDFYFPLFAQLSEHIDDLEDAVFADPSKALLGQILRTRKELIRARRLVGAQRDMVNELLRLEGELLPEELRPFIRDLYDHAAQAIELAENSREAISNVAELYQSELNTRMNQVMKLLTIVSSIFIPLSFIVGVYGMNFQPQDREGHSLPHNMPELYQPHGYLTLLGIMGALIIGQLLFFWRKGWFK